MGNIKKRGEMQWQARVRRDGFPHQTKTFMYRDDAEKWVRALEREMETTGFVDRKKADTHSLAKILEQYRDEVTPGKKSAEIETVKINVILKDKALVDLKMTAIDSKAVAAWRDRRLTQVSGGTVNREIDVLSAVLNHARREWGIHHENPIPYVKRPEKAKARDRRLSADEEKYLLAYLESGERKDDGTFSKGTRNPWLAPLLRLALESAMRRGELLSLLWENVDLDRQTAHLPDTKNGDARTVPLSTKAVAILRALPCQAEDNCEYEQREGRVFRTTAMALRKGFTRAVQGAREQYLADCKATKKKPTRAFLEDVHFHDSRHEATSRLAEKLPNLLELSAVTGHRDIRMLKRYYHPRAEDIAKKLG